MITPFDVIYYFIYVACLFFSLYARKESIPGLVFLRVILCFGLVTEIWVEFLQFVKAEANLPYYLYIPVEYSMLVMFYLSNSRGKVFRIALYSSLALYFIAYATFSILYHRFQGYPSAIYNISCLLNSVWLTLLLLRLDHSTDKPVQYLPLFWIYTAYLIFFSGIFFFNGAYNYFLATDSILAKNLRNYINTGLNYILYLVLTYGFLCSRSKR